MIDHEHGAVLDPSLGETRQGGVQDPLGNHLIVRIQGGADLVRHRSGAGIRQRVADEVAGIERRARCAQLQRIGAHLLPLRRRQVAPLQHAIRELLDGAPRPGCIAP